MIVRMAIIKEKMEKRKPNKHMLVRMWRNKNSCILLVETSNGLDTMENGVLVPPKANHRIIL